MDFADPIPGAIVGALVAAVLTFLVRAARNEVAPGDQIVLRYGTAFRVLMWVLWGFPVVVLVIAVISPPKPDEWWIPPALVGGFSVVAGPLSLEVWKRRVELSPTHVCMQSPWGPPVSIAWSQITEIRVREGAGDVEVRDPCRKRIRISLFLSGRRTLADELERRASSVPGVAEVASRIRAVGG